MNASFIVHDSRLATHCIFEVTFRYKPATEVVITIVYLYLGIGIAIIYNIAYEYHQVTIFFST